MFGFSYDFFGHFLAIAEGGCGLLVRDVEFPLTSMNVNSGSEQVTTYIDVLTDVFHAF